MILWNNDIEIQFFEEALKNFASPEKLFYKLNTGYFAYIPKGTENEGHTLQSRNSLIGQFTEKWCKSILEPIVGKFGLYAINGVVCEEIGLSRQSSADLALCTSNKIIQRPENIKLIFEIKMSIVSNYKYTEPNRIEFISDYKHHKGNPSLLRSDSMLKAIGKSISIRVSGNSSCKIPIVTIGNSPISKNYVDKIDFLKSSGVIQGFWSLNPNPCNSEFIKETPQKGFQTFKNQKMITESCKELLESDMLYFSSMVSMPKLGEIIRLANKEKTDAAKAEKFLTLIRG